MLPKVTRVYREFKVTKEHIKHGVRISPGQDPIALMLKEHGFPCTTGLRDVVFKNGFRSRLPTKAKEFIKKYDTKQRVYPFSMKLGVPLEKPRVQ